jgi:copper homeostasis protein
MKESILLEVCVESLESALAAQHGGARRIELCGDLLEGGTTPSAGLVWAARQHLKIAINVMIRPRGGDFLYSDREFEVMEQDVSVAKDLGADGIVLGLLNADGTIDVERTKRLVAIATPLPVTFHRAIDVTRDMSQALEDIIATGAARVLTSGGVPDVSDGAEQVAQLVKQAGDRIIVMPGAGLTAKNIVAIAQTTRAHEMHIALDQPVASGMEYRKPEIPMGGVEGREYLRFETTTDRVREMVRLVSQQN